MARLYSNLKFLRYPGHLKAIEDRKITAPVHVRIKPINHCNHSCWYCAYRADQLQLGDGMDLKDRLPETKMTELVDDLIEMGVEAVTFSGGGEPLLYKPLHGVIEKLSLAGIRVAALSNGTNLKGRVADAFADHATWIRISIDAWNDASYAKSRGIKEGAFSQVVSNMRDFTARKSNCVLGVSFIISKDNVNHIYDVCALMKDVGVDHVKLSAAVISNDVHENNLYHRSIMDKVTAQIECADNLSESGFSVINHYHETEERFDKAYDFCPYLQFLTVIGADGSVYTCQDKAYNETGLMGSIKDRSFKEFWYSEENRKRLYEVKPSRDCRHHCITHDKNLAIMEYLSVDPDHGRFV
jgi:radical SAM protein with 4Fe4S-binding SPASM domain